MAHSLELLFDQRTDAALRHCWDLLVAADLPSQARVHAPSNRPHVTLTVADRIDSAADDALRALAARLPLRCEVGAPLLFGTVRFTLARLIVPSAPLLDFQRAVHASAAPHLVRGPAPHTEPGRWTPHVTLGRRLLGADLARAVELPGLGAEVSGELVGLRRWDGDSRVEHRLLG